MSKKSIAIMGATGSQGGGLARAILNDPSHEFTARVLTRNPESDKAKILEDAGAEVVAVDIDNFENIKNAFEGAYGAFCVTFFWEHFDPEKEQNQARLMAEAAKATNLKHVIWSTLEDTRNWVSLDDENMPTLMGKYKVPHFDSKGDSNKYFDYENVPTTFLLTSFYWENLIYFNMGPKLDENGKLILSLPMGDKKMPGISAEDIGRCALGVFKNSDDFIGTTLGISGEHLTGDMMAESLEQALGEEIIYNPISFSEYRNSGFPGAEDLGNMFQFKHDFEDHFCGIRDVEMTRFLNPALMNFSEWLEENKNRIPID